MIFFCQLCKSAVIREGRVKSKLKVKRNVNQGIMLISIMQPHQFVVQNQIVDSTNHEFLVEEENEANIPDLLLLLLAKNKALESM